MVDTLTVNERSAQMRLIRSNDTSPEMAVRKIVFRMGYRYRLHLKKLPGRPDIVLTRLKKVIFVHGCFWHRHKNCRLARLPKSKLGYWVPKLQKNAARDGRNQRALRKLGWGVMVVWECKVAPPERLARRVNRFLEPVV